MQPLGAEWLPKGCCSPQNAFCIVHPDLIRKHIIHSFFTGEKRSPALSVTMSETQGLPVHGLSVMVTLSTSESSGMASNRK